MVGPRALMLTLVTGLALSTLAATSPAGGQSAKSEVRFNNTGVGRMSVEPDFAVVVFSVRAISKTAQGAVAENTRNVDALLNALHAFTGSGDRIETAGFQLAPVSGAYLVATEVQVRTLRVKDVGRLIDVGVRGGADRVASIGFGREHTKEAIQAAVQQAIVQARENAAAVAAGLGLRSIRIVSIEPSIDQPEGAMVLHVVAARENASPESTIQAGPLTLTAHVAIQFLLAP